MRTIQTAAGRQNGKSRPPHSTIGCTRLMAIAERFALVALILTSFLLGAFGALAGTWTPRSDESVSNARYGLIASAPYPTSAQK